MLVYEDCFSLHGYNGFVLHSHTSLFYPHMTDCGYPSILERDEILHICVTYKNVHGFDVDINTCQGGCLKKCNTFELYVAAKTAHVFARLIRYVGVLWNNILL